MTDDSVGQLTYGTPAMTDMLKPRAAACVAETFRQVAQTLKRTCVGNT
jgi:hypothetical protein